MSWDAPELDTPLARLLHARGRVPLPALQALLGEARGERPAAGETLALRLLQRGLLPEDELAGYLRELSGAASAPAGPDRWEPGAVVAGHRLLERLGAGGMGTVFLAEDLSTGARRALKVLEAGADPTLVLRFQREAQAQAAVDRHPNVVRVHACGQAGGARYIVLDLAEGGDLARRLADGPLAPRAVAELGAALARGLAHVHRHGVLHRDLKPQNVLFDGDGTPRLVDFGLARQEGAASLTRTGEVLGTPAYMAPEQAAGRRDLEDERTDVYGLGALLYHALTGRPPVVGANVLMVLHAVVHEGAPPVRAVRPDAPPALAAVIERALARDPARRYAGAAAMGAALEALLGGEGGRGRRVRPRWLATLPPGVAAVLLGLWLALGRAGDRGEPRASEAGPGPPRAVELPAAGEAAARAAPLLLTREELLARLPRSAWIPAETRDMATLEMLLRASFRADENGLRAAVELVRRDEDRGWGLLARRLRWGVALPVDEVAARSALELGAARGDPLALLDLGDACRTGVLDIAVDLERAARSYAHGASSVPRVPERDAVASDACAASLAWLRAEQGSDLLAVEAAIADVERRLAASGHPRLRLALGVLALRRCDFEGARARLALPDGTVAWLPDPVAEAAARYHLADLLWHGLGGPPDPRGAQDLLGRLVSEPVRPLLDAPQRERSRPLLLRAIWLGGPGRPADPSFVARALLDDAGAGGEGLIVTDDPASDRAAVEALAARGHPLARELVGASLPASGDEEALARVMVELDRFPAPGPLPGHIDLMGLAPAARLVLAGEWAWNPDRERDEREALACFRDALRLDSEEGRAWANLGDGLLRQGLRGVPYCPQAAALCFERAASRGDPRGSLWLGRLHHHGLCGRPRDLEQARRCYEAALALPEPFGLGTGDEARLELARLAVDAPELVSPERALALLDARSGVAPGRTPVWAAITRAQVHALRGQGDDRARARAMLEPLCPEPPVLQDEAWAAAGLTLADLLLDGRAGPPDVARARRLLEALRPLREAHVRILLAALRWAGAGGPVDLCGAAQLLIDHPDRPPELAPSARTTRDEAAAREWLERAAASGWAPAVEARPPR